MTFERKRYKLEDDDKKRLVQDFYSDGGGFYDDADLDGRALYCRGRKIYL